jgi:uncharacterized protein YndB with AHSA1/START domain
MSTDTATPGTVRLHRVLRAKPERIYRAFIDPDAMAKWLPPHGFTGKVHHMDAQVGGTYRMSFTNFNTGSSQRLRYDDQFEDPNLPGTMITTVELREVFCGTELHITQEGIPGMIPVEACYLGWQESLELLDLLTGPEIPDQM